MPNITVNFRMHLVSPNEERYKFQLPHVQSEKESEESEDDTSLPKLYYSVPSRTHLRPPGYHEVFSFH